MYLIVWTKFKWLWIMLFKLLYEHFIWLFNCVDYFVYVQMDKMTETREKEHA
jgi:hypothetical protein